MSERKPSSLIRHIGKKRFHHWRAYMQGFTLIELLVTFSLVAILMSFAIPSLYEATLSSKLSGNANRLVASMALARSEAIKRNVAITLCMSANGTSCTTNGGWQQGWIILLSGSTTVLLYEAAAAPSVKINESSNLTRLNFQATVVGASVATFVVCQAVPRPGNQEREIRVDATGRSYVKKTVNGVCA